VALPSSSSTIAVSAVLHRGVINCPPRTPLGEVAALMAEQSVHCVVVDGSAQGPHHSEQLVWGIVPDVDLIRAAGSGRLDAEAGEAAASEIVTIDPEEDIERAAQIIGRARPLTPDRRCTRLRAAARRDLKPRPREEVSRGDRASESSIRLRSFPASNGGFPRLVRPPRGRNLPARTARTSHPGSRAEPKLSQPPTPPI
jgi:CBS domain-containing protein